MCDERERLIGYLYGECDAAERAEIDRHVTGCETCREEIAGLNATRQDLLAWEVPEHVSVWKPFAPARQRPWWREVPAWAFAAAAGVMFLIGVSGGVVAQSMLLRPVATTAEVVPAPAPAVTKDAVSRDEIAAFQDKLQRELQANLVRISQLERSATAVRAVPASVTDQDDLQFYLSVNAAINKLQTRVDSLQQQNKELRLLVMQGGQPQPSR